MKITCFALSALLLAGCVSVDSESGKVIPRGSQKYEFATVERQAKNLKVGMTKLEALLLLGGPAETSGDGNVWVYLPERPAVLVPSRALKLEFEGGILKKHGYSAIVLGQQF